MKVFIAKEGRIFQNTVTKETYCQELYVSDDFDESVLAEISEPSEIKFTNLMEELPE